MSLLLRSLSVLLLLGGAPLWAQRVQVEVLVFAWAAPDRDAALSADDPDPAYASGAGLDEPGSQMLARESLRLGGSQDALARHARTRALVHAGWQQDAGSGRTTRLRSSRMLQTSDPARGLLAGEVPEFEGEISLRSGRGVEVQFDGLLRLAQGDRSGRPLPPQRFRLSTRRVMGYGEIHYLDHPALGVIVRVDTLQPPAEAAP